MRFGILVYPWDVATVVESATTCEQLGYDTLYAADTVFSFALPDLPFLDGWAVLGHWVALTTRIRLGVHVANLTWRNPVLLARSVIALDQLSGGRFELGVGAGRFDDQAMMNSLDMPAPERIARLDEGITVIDRLLRGDLTPFSGRFTTYTDAQTAPGPVQQPRPPILVAAHGPRALDIAARHGDVWGSWGGADISTYEELIDTTRTRNATLTAACETIGRDPTSIRRQIIVSSDIVDPWDNPDLLLRLVDELGAMDFDELAFYMPLPHQRAQFEHTSLEVLPQLR